MKHVHNYSTMYKVHSVVILSIPMAFLVPFLLLIVVTTVFAVCVMRLTVRWSLHFVALGFFFLMQSL